METPDETPAFQFPEDPGERMAWMKNFVEKAPKYVRELGITQAEIDEMQRMYGAARAEKDVEDAERLRQIERRLCAVPDGWPAPPVLMELIKAIPAMDEPARTRMIEQAEAWGASIARAGSPLIAPRIWSGYFDQGLMIEFELPPQGKWAHMYFRGAGEMVWRFLCTVPRRYGFFTNPAERDEADGPLPECIEVVAIARAAGEDARRGYGEFMGAPSNVLMLPVPTEYPVPR